MAQNNHKRLSDDISLCTAWKPVPQMVQEICQPECTYFGPNREIDWNGYLFVQIARTTRMNEM